MRLEEARGIPSDKQIGSFFLFFHDKTLPPFPPSHKTSITAASPCILRHRQHLYNRNECRYGEKGRANRWQAWQFSMYVCSSARLTHSTAQQVLYSTQANPRFDKTQKPIPSHNVSHIISETQSPPTLHFIVINVTLSLQDRQSTISISISISK